MRTQYYAELEKPTWGGECKVTITDLRAEKAHSFRGGMKVDLFPFRGTLFPIVPITRRKRCPHPQLSFSILCANHPKWKCSLFFS